MENIGGGWIAGGMLGRGSGGGGLEDGRMGKRRKIMRNETMLDKMSSPRRAGPGASLPFG